MKHFLKAVLAIPRFTVFVSAFALICITLLAVSAVVITGGSGLIATIASMIVSFVIGLILCILGLVLLVLAFIVLCLAILLVTAFCAAMIFVPGVIIFEIFIKAVGFRVDYKNEKLQLNDLWFGKKENRAEDTVQESPTAP